MNKLCVLLMLMWLNESEVTSSVIPIDSQSRGPVLMVDGQHIELHESEDSWLQMVLVFSRDHPRTPAHLHNLTGIPDLTTTTIVTTTARPTAATITTALSTVGTTDSSTALPTSNGTCKPDFIPVGDHCYYFSSAKATFNDASIACHGLGAALVHPKNAKDNLLLMHYIRENNKTAIGWWIGATDRDNEGQWVWAHDKSPVDYDDWLGGEPNNAYENENCAQLRKDVDYKWNDAPCENKYQYTCQYLGDDYQSGDGKHEENIPSTTTAANLTVSKSDYVQLGEHSYYLSSTKATFDQASKACQSIDAQLAHPMNEEENTQLTEYLQKKYEGNYKGWWIGATDEDVEDLWLWTHDGSPVGYTDWSSGEPNDGQENEHCAHYRKDKDHKWNDVPCNNKYHYICQNKNLDFDSKDESSGFTDLEDED